MAHGEIEITAELVRDLLYDQHPDLAGRPITFGARGWDNQLWRLGDDLAVRLPWAGPRCGCTATCIRPTFSLRTAPSAA